MERVFADGVLSYEASNTAATGAHCSLLRRPGSEDSIIDGGWTALTLAAEMGEDEVVAQLLEDGALPDVPDASGRTALVRATSRGHVQAAARLLEAGASPHLESMDGRSALAIASELGRTSIVRLLLNASCAYVRGGAAAVPEKLPRRLLGRSSDELKPEQAQALAVLQEEMELLGIVGREADRNLRPSWPVSSSLLAAASQLPRTDKAGGALVRGSIPSAHADQALAVKHLLGAGARVDLWRALALAQQNGHAAVASLLGEPATLLRMTRYEGPQIANEMVRAVERDVRAVEAWLRGGAMSAANDTEHLEASVSDLLSGWSDGVALDAIAEEDAAAVVARLRSRGVWVEVQQRACGGFVLRFRSACYAIEVERMLVASDGPRRLERRRPAVTIERESGRSSSGGRAVGKHSVIGYLGQRVAVKRRLARGAATERARLDASSCHGYDCIGCGEGVGLQPLAGNPSRSLPLGPQISINDPKRRRQGGSAGRATYTPEEALAGHSLRELRESIEFERQLPSALRVLWIACGILAGAAGMACIAVVLLELCGYSTVRWLSRTGLTHPSRTSESSSPHSASSHSRAASSSTSGSSAAPHVADATLAPTLQSISAPIEASVLIRHATGGQPEDAINAQHATANPRRRARRRPARPAVSAGAGAVADDPMAADSGSSGGWSVVGARSGRGGAAGERLAPRADSVDSTSHHRSTADSSAGAPSDTGGGAIGALSLPALPVLPPLPPLRQMPLGVTCGRAIMLGREEVVRGTGNFADERKIGEGGFGVVWKAQSLPSIGVGAYAVKRLGKALHGAAARSREEATGDGSPWQQLQLEVGLLARCSHPHILPVVGYCTDPLTPCLVYPLCAGGNFEDRLVPSEAGAQRLRLLGLRPAPLTWRHRLGVVRDVADALVYLHAPTASKPRILHRDVKPSNILLSLLASSNPATSGTAPPLVAWLSDVGVAKADELLPSPEHTHLSTCTVRGTPGFVDSLVVNGLQHSEATDGFALGITLLMSLTGLSAVGLLSECHEILRRTEEPAVWKARVDGIWPTSVASEVAKLAYGLTMPMFKEDRMPIASVLLRLEALLSHADAEPEEGPTLGVADELRVCVVCDDAQREVRFRCGHACCCAACAVLIERSGSRCPICRGLTHPLLASGAHLRNAPTFELR